MKRFYALLATNQEIKKKTKNKNKMKNEKEQKPLKN